VKKKSKRLGWWGDWVVCDENASSFLPFGDLHSKMEDGEQLMLCTMRWVWFFMNAGVQENEV
jgi:hypothetical protein